MKITIGFSVTANILRTHTPIKNEDKQSDPWSNNMPMGEDDPKLFIVYWFFLLVCRLDYQVFGILVGGLQI